jgi:hypothetical protein
MLFTGSQGTKARNAVRRLCNPDVIRGLLGNRLSQKQGTGGNEALHRVLSRYLLHNGGNRSFELLNAEIRGIAYLYNGAFSTEGRKPTDNTCPLFQSVHFAQLLTVDTANKLMNSECAERLDRAHRCASHQASHGLLEALDGTTKSLSKIEPALPTIWGANSVINGQALEDFGFVRKRAILSSWSPADVTQLCGHMQQGPQ